MSPRRFLLVFVLLVVWASLVGCVTPTPEPDYARPLPEGANALLPLEPGVEPPDVSSEWYARQQILPALDHSIDWMRLPSSSGHYPIAGISHARALASLERFRELLLTSSSSRAFGDAVEREFTVYRSAGWDGHGGGVLFTGYCTPILSGSRTSDARYRFPLYALPDDVVKGANGEVLGRRVGDQIFPYPSRRILEERDALAGRGLELVWLRDPVDAYLAHVNGSAVIELRDGELLRLGYAGTNGREYSSLRADLVAKGAIDPDTSGLPAIRRWAAVENEGAMLDALRENDRFVFFTPIASTPHGSLNVPVTAERTLATDKSLFPRGALVFVETRLPGEPADARSHPFHKIMLDQDTGGAIRTAGRADIYLGTGPEAEVLAGRTAEPGQMYYLFLGET